MKQRLKTDRMVLMFIIFFFIFTPIFIYLLTLRFKAQDLLDLKNLTKNNPLSSNPVNPLDELKKNLENTVRNNTSASNNSVSTSYSGPTLSFKLNIEGRNHDQSTRLFIGLAQGEEIVENPAYILSFLVEVPITGEYSGISITGIDIGAPFTAYFKGSTQLTKAVKFNSQPKFNDLGTVDLLTGDLNEDNLINSADADLLKKQFGKTPFSPDWNPYNDFNSDEVINSIDLSFITKNLNKVGDSGAWVSSPLKAATTPQTQTLGISTSTKDASESGNGYWLWIPKY